jgi:hypothetical protein
VDRIRLHSGGGANWKDRREHSDSATGNLAAPSAQPKADHRPRRPRPVSGETRRLAQHLEKLAKKWEGVRHKAHTLGG